MADLDETVKGDMCFGDDAEVPDEPVITGCVTVAKSLKEWVTPIWAVVKNGDPVDYAFSRAGAFKKAAGYRRSQPTAFWSVARGHGAVVLRVIR